MNRPTAYTRPIMDPQKTVLIVMNTFRLRAEFVNGTRLPDAVDQSIPTIVKDYNATIIVCHNQNLTGTADTTVSSDGIYCTIKRPQS